MPEPARGDTDATHWADLHGWASRRLGDPGLAADLVQEAYLRLSGLPANTVILDSRAWLFATLRNLVADHWRRGSPRRHAPLDDLSDAELGDDRPGAEQGLLSREELAVLQAAVASLPPRTREVFRLHKFEQLSYADIAARLGMAKNTVVVHMVKALAHCRAAIRAYQAGGTERWDSGAQDRR